VVHERFPIDSEMMQVWNLWGGLLYLIAPPKTQVEGVEVIIQGAVPAPYYKTGKWVGGRGREVGLDDVLYTLVL
jgi:hypothetical protein